MTEREKLWFNQMADDDKKRFEFENQVRKILSKTNLFQVVVTKKKKVKRMKDPNAPKRALSGFFWFSQV